MKDHTLGSRLSLVQRKIQLSAKYHTSTFLLERATMSGLQTAVVLFLISQWKGPCALFVINLHVNMSIAKRLAQKNWALYILLLSPTGPFLLDRLCFLWLLKLCGWASHFCKLPPLWQELWLPCVDFSFGSSHFVLLCMLWRLPPSYPEFVCEVLDTSPASLCVDIMW